MMRAISAWVTAQRASAAVPMLIVAGVLVMVIGIAGAAYYRGYDNGAVDARLEQLDRSKQETARKLHADSLKAKKAKMQAAIAEGAARAAEEKSRAARLGYERARTKIQVRGDTVFVPGATVVLPEITELIRTADVQRAADSVTIAELKLVPVKKDILIAHQDTLIRDLSERIAIADLTVDVLTKMKRPRCGAKCGAIMGVVTVLSIVAGLSK